MSLPSVAEILSDHVTFELECIDRMYANLYIPRLQSEPGVVGFFRGHRGHAFASSALMAPIRNAFVAALDAFAQENDIPMIASTRASAKTTSLEHTSPGSTATTVSSSSERPRRRPR